MVAIAFIRRILGRGRGRADGVSPVDGVLSADPVPPPDHRPQAGEPAAELHAVPEAPVVDAVDTGVTCPNCGTLVDPPPVHTRLCPHCRHRIVVRKLHGRAVYLAEAAVAVFEAERERERLEHTWSVERHHWLELARRIRAPEDRLHSLAGAPLTAGVVASSRALYLSTADQTVRAARRVHDWNEVARIRREQAAALFTAAGRVLPPTDEMLALHREGEIATLRALARISRQAELVGATCCAGCRADNGGIFKVADELRTPRLPHAGCSHGLCACDWWPALGRSPVRSRRRQSQPTGGPEPGHAAPPDMPPGGEGESDRPAADAPGADEGAGADSVR